MTRLLVATALAAAALAPAAASADGPRCRVVMDPRGVSTPIGTVQVPYYYVYCYPEVTP